jgi:hypothetical protein
MGQKFCVKLFQSCRLGCRTVVLGNLKPALQELGSHQYGNMIARTALDVSPFVSLVLTLY